MKSEIYAIIMFLCLVRLTVCIINKGIKLLICGCLGGHYVSTEYYLKVLKLGRL